MQADRAPQPPHPQSQQQRASQQTPHARSSSNPAAHGLWGAVCDVEECGALAEGRESHAEGTGAIGAESAPSARRTHTVTRGPR
eukprot:CAMPEP_0206155978 /NCGR_PEP_ID=MMETSP1474-20131121/2571_1 /ASSEMBLY_ACC=CAM_ASM_001110 /TAXON_ID=97495 /ORGANISM="Imantonia sp., Strain RCC918" /LENGTH=83 /DNA_ID=CAMNT_0053554845 /DNA_START=79 /DNA_END=328 /DNA_ORIENTATION=+